jgi:hypothetical protein
MNYSANILVTWNAWIVERFRGLQPLPGFHVGAAADSAHGGLSDKTVRPQLRKLYLPERNLLWTLNNDCHAFAVAAVWHFFTFHYFEKLV